MQVSIGYEHQMVKPESAGSAACFTLLACFRGYNFTNTPNIAGAAGSEKEAARDSCYIHVFVRLCGVQ